MQWLFRSPNSIGCSVQGQKLTLLVPFVLALNIGPVPQCGEYWILTGGQAYICSLMKFRRALFPLFIFAYS